MGPADTAKFREMTMSILRVTIIPLRNTSASMRDVQASSIPCGVRSLSLQIQQPNKFSDAKTMDYLSTLHEMHTNNIYPQDTY